MLAARWKMPVAAMAFLLLACGGFVRAAEETKEPSAEEKEKLFQRAVDTAIAHMEKSRLYYKKNDHEKAFEELKQIIEIDFPKGSEDRDEYTVVYDSYINAGMLLVKMEKPKEARLLVAEGVKKAPEVSEWGYDLYMTQGKILEELDMDEDAIKSFDKAMEIQKKLAAKTQKKKAGNKAKQQQQAETGEGTEK